MHRRFPAIFLLLTWLALGTGVLGYAHNLQDHADEACHDNSSNCRLHAQIYSPAEPVVAPILLTRATNQLGILRLSNQTVVSVSFCWTYDSRGPPAA